MNDYDEIELPKSSKRGAQTKPKKIYHQQIDLTIDEDLRQIEESKGELEEQYEQYEQYENYDPQAYKEGYPEEYYQDGEQEQEEEYDENDFPPIPIRTFAITILLLITGISFIVLGVYSYMGHASTSKILTFMFLGVFLTSPGCIYLVFIWQAARAKTPEEKEEVINQIPI